MCQVGSKARSLCKHWQKKVVTQTTMSLSNTQVIDIGPRPSCSYFIRILFSYIYMRNIMGKLTCGKIIRGSLAKECLNVTYND